MAHENTIRVVDTTVPRTIPLDLVYLWYRNLTTRRYLARLSIDGLRDVGISKCQRAVDLAKPFWRS